MYQQVYLSSCDLSNKIENSLDRPVSSALIVLVIDGQNLYSPSTKGYVNLCLSWVIGFLGGRYFLNYAVS